MIQTARGPIHKSELGLTLGHEHIKWENDENYANTMYFDRKYDDGAIAEAFEKIMPVMSDLKKHGCKAIIETSPPIGGQNVKLMKALSEAADMHLVPCTGWNITKQLYHVFPEGFEDQLAKWWIKDYREGLDTLDGVTIRPGHIKLLLSRGDLSPSDAAMLRAAVRASKATGMPIHCHILEAKMVHEVIALLDQEDADYSKFLWAHADEENHLETIRTAAEKGMWIGIDNIRQGTSPERYELIKTVMDMGYGHRVLISMDYTLYDEYVEKGADHLCKVLFTEFMPYCEERGMSRRTIEEMMTVNPAEFYDI